MYYTGFNGEVRQIGLAVSEDGLTWKKIGEAIRVGKSGEWDCHFIEWHSAYVLEDGVNFTKYSKNPIFKPSGSEGVLDKYHVATPFFVALNKNRLLLVYSGGGSPHYPTSLWCLGLAQTKEL